MNCSEAMANPKEQQETATLMTTATATAATKVETLIKTICNEENKELHVIEDRIDLVKETHHHVMFYAIVITRELSYQVKFVIYVNKQTYDLLKSASGRTMLAMDMDMVGLISNVANERIWKLIPSLKCFKCNKPACQIVRSGSLCQVSSVPTILEVMNLPSCKDCEQDVQNYSLDHFGNKIVDDMMIKQCENCWKYAEKMKCCARCRAAFYCSPECQRNHWKKGDHKQVCKPYKKDDLW